MNMELYGTLGPSCARAETLGRMLDAGMTGARLNLSHTGLKGAAKYIEALFEAGRIRGLIPSCSLIRRVLSSGPGRLSVRSNSRRARRSGLVPEAYPCRKRCWPG